MISNMNRRAFLSSTVKVGASITLGSTLVGLTGCSEEIKRPTFNLKSDPKGICDLPEGFSYTIISAYGEMMNDGLEVPDYHDGMGCFAGPNNAIVLVRNHEISTYFPTDPPSPLPEHAYDPDSSGGTTTIWLDQKMKVTKHFMSLTGTIRNCSGGVTPWNTWISSEEAANEGWFMGKRHGYNFEVDPFSGIKKVEPLKAMGRFNHEGVAISTQSGIAYQTEDNPKGCFYRFIPNKRQQLADGGELQALKFSDGSITHTSKDKLQLNKAYPCQWVTVEEPDPEENTVYQQAKAKGAAVFVRGEGIIAEPDGIYFVCTSGGAKNRGQIFKYTENHDGSGFITLVYEADDTGIIDRPDNITTNQWGDLILCEDTGLDKKCLVGLTPQKKVYYIAANTQAEWAGACFSPDQKTLFVNIHKKPGMTLAIQGPWEKLRS